MANKVKYGLKNVHYAVGTPANNGSFTYETPVRIPGAVNLSFEAQGETSPFYADDGTYFVGNSNSGYQGDLEVAKFPVSFRKDVLGEAEDGNGVVYEDANAPVVHFALLFEFDGDESATRYVMPNCTATRPSVASTTKTETTEVQTETSTISAKAAYIPAIDKYVPKAYAEKTQTPYATWYETVYQPIASE